jgi:endogenous inhibitor of DNA gyrase (YacG/DUF329 family)
VKTVACPRCGKKAELSATNKWRPFCSERCWAAEDYRVPLEEKPKEEKP